VRATTIWATQKKNSFLFLKISSSAHSLHISGTPTTQSISGNFLSHLRCWRVTIFRKIYLNIGTCCWSPTTTHH
jgi:hypothetical protein